MADVTVGEGMKNGCSKAQVFIGRLCTEAPSIPSQVLDLLCDARRRPPWNELAHCDSCGVKTLTTPTLEMACSNCSRGRVSLTWTESEAKRRLLLLFRDKSSSIHVASVLSDGTLTPVGFIEMWPVLIAKVDELGYGMVVISVARKFGISGVCFFVNNLIVAQEYRRRGIGRDLLERAIRHHQVGGRAIPVMMVAENSATKIPWPERLGIPVVARLSGRQLLLMGAMLRSL